MLCHASVATLCHFLKSDSSPVNHNSPLRLTLYTFLSGHCLAGSVFLLWGLWWMIISFYAHFKSLSYSRHPKSRQPPVNLLSSLCTLQNDSLAYQSWITLPFWSKVPLEPIIKIALTGLGVFCEIFFWAPLDQNGHNKLGIHVYRVDFIYTYNVTGYPKPLGEFGDMSRFHHMTLYSCFLVSGIMDLLSFYLHLPSATGQLFLSFAFYCEAVLFSFHVHGRDVFNTAIHQLLLIFVYGCAAFSTLRLLNPRHLLINSGLAGSMILQGTHLIQAGFILYGTGTYIMNPTSHENVKMMAAVTIWHFHATCLFMLLVFITMRKIMLSSRSYNYIRVSEEEEVSGIFHLTDEAERAKELCGTAM